ncbi:hypothetical protein KI387_001537, partial [Taxus chinensis]
MARPSTRAKKNPVTQGKTPDKDGIVIEEMESKGVNINSSALGFTSVDHKVSQVEYELRSVQSEMAFKGDIAQINHRLDDIMQHVKGKQYGPNPSHINQGGSSVENPRQNNHVGSLFQLNQNPTYSQPRNMMLKVEMCKFD